MHPHLTHALAEARRAELIEMAARQRILDDPKPKMTFFRRFSRTKTLRRRRIAIRAGLAALGH